MEFTCADLTRLAARKQYSIRSDDGKTSVQRPNSTKPAKTRLATFKLTPEQYKLIEQRAERCKVSMSAWMRAILLQAASRPARKGYLHIPEPNGSLT